MKLNNITQMTAMLLFVLLGSCTNDQDADLTAGTDSAVLGKEISFEQSKGKELKTVNLGVAGDFVILSKTGITSVYKSYRFCICLLFR